jgi:hypothetical protein
MTNAQELKNLLRECLVFNRNEFEFLTLSYRLLSMKTVGSEVTDLLKVLHCIDRDSKESVNHQFLRLADNPIAENLIEKENKDLLKVGYKVGLMRIEYELKLLEPVVGARKISTFKNSLRKFMLHYAIELFSICSSVVTYNEILEWPMKDLFRGIDEMFSAETSVA